MLGFYLLVLLPVHSGPGELGRLEAVVEVPLAFGIGEEEDLGIGADESDSLSRVNLVAAETAELRLQNQEINLLVERRARVELLADEGEAMEWRESRERRG
ncbi:hypothetical protein ACFX14_040347 [Malus domestica]